MLTLPLHVYYVREREAAKQRTSDRTDSTWSVYSSRETHDYSTQVYQVKVAGEWGRTEQYTQQLLRNYNNNRRNGE